MSGRAFIDQLADVWSALSDLGHGLEPADWARPTDCPGWSVQDHVSHVIGTELMLAGRPAPPAAPAGLAHVLNPIGELNEAWVLERRSWPRSRVIDELDAVTAERLDRLRAMTDDQLATPGPSPIGTVPYATFMDVRVMDCWVHEQDMRWALGRPARFEGVAAEAAMARLVALFAYVVGKKVKPPEGAAVTLVLTGPLGRTVPLEIRDGRAVAAEGGAPARDTIEMDTETYVRLTAGRLAPEAALAEGAVRFEGDRPLGATVVSNLNQMP